MSRVTRSQSKKEIKKIEEVEQKKVVHKKLIIIPTVKATTLHIKGFPVMGMTFEYRKGFNKARTLELVEKAQKDLQGENKKGLSVKMMVAVQSRDVGWRTAKSFDLTKDDPNIYWGGENGAYDGAEWDTVKKIVVYFWKQRRVQNMFFPKSEGGIDDKYNNCFINCIYDVFTREGVPKGYRTAWSFKKNIGLEKCNKIPIKLIPTIEDKLKIKIDVEGDYTYISEKTYLKSIVLTLTDEHYDVKKIAKNDLLKGMSFKVQKPIIVEDSDGDLINAYDGEVHYEITWDKKKEIYSKPRSSKHYIYICDIGKKGEQTKEDLEESYNNLIKDADALCDATNGRINLHKCRGNTRMATMKLFYSNISHLKNSAPIAICEGNWIDSANHGGLIFAEKTDWFNGYNYDGNSFYSANLLKFGIPMESGEFKTLNEFEDFFRYGIYRCKVYHSGDNKIDRLFKLNKRNFYTHFDLEGAKLLGLKIELINDGNPNHLCYTGKHIRGCDVFKTTIEYLYKLKQDKVPRAKELLSKLWGSLGRKNKHYLNSKYKTDIPEEADIISIIQNNNGNYHVEYTLPEAENLYCHNFGRIAPFIQAYGRYQMAKIILPNNEYIVRGHTDSFLANKELELGTFFGAGLGQFKLDKQGNCKVENKCKVLYDN